jgi:hypothetical protein
LPSVRLAGSPLFAKVNSFLLLGIDTQLCEVEVDASQHGSLGRGCFNPSALLLTG